MPFCRTINYFVYLAPTIAPVDIKVLEILSSSVLFSWKSPPANATNGINRGYYLIFTEKDSGKDSQLTVKSPPYLFQALHPFRNYSLQIAAITVEIGRFSDSFSVTTPFFFCLPICQFSLIPQR